MTQTTNQFRWLTLTMLVLIFDQASKLWVAKILTPFQAIKCTSFLNIVLTYNPGAAFSFLGNAGGWQRWFFVVIAVVISLCILYWLARAPRHDNWTACSFSLILAGALGNLFDRLAFGQVTDFIDLHLGDLHFPAYFNIADLAINIGIIIWLIGALVSKKQ